MSKENNQNDRTKLITIKCPECQQLDPVDGITCHAGVVSSGDPEESKKSCVWFWPKHKYNTKLSEPSGRRVDPCNCSHHGEPILGSAHGRCNHPANFATATTCGFWNAADCFRLTEKENTKTGDTPPPAPSTPATESDPNGLKPSDPGAKLDSGKNMLGLVLDGFAPAIVEVGKVGTYGATKYSPNGWKSVEGAKRRYMDALMRHLFAHLNGEKIDKESGLSHLAHAAWNVLALLTFEIKGGGE